MERIDSVTLANKDYVAEQYRRYKADPRSVGEEWALFFAGFELGASSNGAAVGGVAAGVPAATSAPVIGVFDLVHSYRELGYLVADLNPLAPKPAGHPLLEPSEFGFGDEDLDRVVSCGGFRGCSRTSIRDLIARLQATYCGTLGVEYMHIQDQEQRVWLQERMETTSNRPDLSPEHRLAILDSLITAEGLEPHSRTSRFLASQVGNISVRARPEAMDHWRWAGEVTAGYFQQLKGFSSLPQNVNRNGDRLLVQGQVARPRLRLATRCWQAGRRPLHPW